MIHKLFNRNPRWALFVAALIPSLAIAIPICVEVGGRSIVPALGVTGTLLAGNGTAALPAYSFTSDTDTGVYRSDADTVAVSTLGVLTFSVAPTVITNVVGMTSQAASGSNAYAIGTNGARFDLGDGVSDHASSDGTTVIFAGPTSTTKACLVMPCTDYVQSGGGANIKFVSNNSEWFRVSGSAASVLFPVTTVTALIEGAITAAAASSTVAAYTFRPTTALDANDLHTAWRNSAGTLLASIDVEGDVAATSLVFGTGTAITGSVKATAAIDFTSILTAVCQRQTMTLTGALVDDPVACSYPAGLVANLAASCWVTATDVVTFQLCNVTIGSIDPASGNFAARIIR